MHRICRERAVYFYTSRQRQRKGTLHGSSVRPYTLLYTTYPRVLLWCSCSQSFTCRFTALLLHELQHVSTLEACWWPAMAPRSLRFGPHAHGLWCLPFWPAPLGSHTPPGGLGAQHGRQTPPCSRAPRRDTLRPPSAHRVRACPWDRVCPACWTTPTFTLRTVRPVRAIHDVSLSLRGPRRALRLLLPPYGMIGLPCALPSRLSKRWEPC